MKTYNIALIKGDGIGPEIVDEAVKVLDAVAARFDFSLRYQEVLMGGSAYDVTGDPLPQETINVSLNSDAVLFGAIGGEKWDSLPREKRPESGLLRFRKELGVFANLRPAVVYDELVNASSLKPEIVQGVDLMVVRELIGGIYFGEPKGREGDKAFNTMVYTKEEVVRIAHTAFKIAMERSKKSAPSTRRTSSMSRRCGAKPLKRSPKRIRRSLCRTCTSTTRPCSSSVTPNSSTSS